MRSISHSKETLLKSRSKREIPEYLGKLALVVALDPTNCAEFKGCTSNVAQNQLPHYLEKDNNIHIVNNILTFSGIFLKITRQAKKQKKTVTIKQNQLQNQFGLQQTKESKT